jgi:hypothetical protein
MTGKTLAEEDYVFLPVGKATQPPSGGFFQHYVDHWWVVHPKKGLVFYNPSSGGRRRDRHRIGAPQCNSDERISRHVAEKTVPFAYEIRHISSAWVPIDPHDYQ